MIARLVGRVSATTEREALPASSRAGMGALEASERGLRDDVELVRITKRFGPVIAVDDLTLSVAAGTFYSLLGPSGCGKTTTLRLIAGFEQPSTGEIRIGGSPVAGVPAYRRNVNTVFQHYALFPHLDVEANVGYGLKQRGVPPDERRRRAGEALEMVRLAGFQHRRTWQLSGGQQQRIALARALVNKPTVLLLDEPLGALDMKLRKEMQLELKRLQLETGITFVYVTHDQEEALMMSDRLAVMSAGRIQQEGTPREVYDRPATRYVADFIGLSNFLPARVVGAGDPMVVSLPNGRRVSARPAGADRVPAPGSTVTLVVRPEKVRVAVAGHQVSASRAAGGMHAPGATDVAPIEVGRVTDVTYLGETTEIRVRTDALGEVVARRQNADAAQGGSGVSVGDAAAIWWDDGACLALEADRAAEPSAQ